MISILFIYFLYMYTMLCVRSVSILTIMAMIFSATLSNITTVSALSLTTLSNTQSSLKVSTLSDHSIQFVTPSGVGAGQNITLEFPVQYTMGTFTVTNVDFATSTSASCTSFNDEPLASSASGATWGVAQSGNTITITSDTATVPANRCVRINIGSNASFGGVGVSQITNPASANYYALTLGGTFGDSGIITTNIITDDTVALSGVVSQSLTFSISTSTIYFGILSSGGVKYASSSNTAGDTTETVAHTLQVGTNAASGFVVTVMGQTLTSQQNTSNVITAIGGVAASSTPGNEQFGLRITESGGVGTAVASPYLFSSSYAYAATATTSSVVATGSGSTPMSTYSVRYLANIGTITEAGTYAANLVYIATANF
jgi:hypothetical protein